jgi:hypothetical protein
MSHSRLLTEGVVLNDARQIMLLSRYRQEADNCRITHNTINAMKVYHVIEVFAVNKHATSKGRT